MKNKPLKVGIILDPITSIDPKKDSSFAMALEATRRGSDLYYFEQKHLFISSWLISMPRVVAPSSQDKIFNISPSPQPRSRTSDPFSIQFFMTSIVSI